MYIQKGESLLENASEKNTPNPVDSQTIMRYKDLNKQSDRYQRLVF